MIDLSCELLLFFIVTEVFKLSPNKVSLLHFVCKGIPRSSCYQSSHHVRVVAFSDKYFKSMLVLEWYFNIQSISIVNLPK